MKSSLCKIFYSFLIVALLAGITQVQAESHQNEKGLEKFSIYSESGLKLKRFHVAFLLYEELNLQTMNGKELKLTDVDNKHKYFNEIKAVMDYGYFQDIVKGAQFKPEAEMTRAEIAAVFTRVYDINNRSAVPFVFSDVTPEHWAYDAIQSMASNGITTGVGNGIFAPKQSITMNQFSVFLSRVKDKDLRKLDYYIGVVENGILTIKDEEYGSFDAAFENVIDESQVILENRNIVWMKEGIIRALDLNHNTVSIYRSDIGNNRLTYVNAATEMEFVGITNNLSRVEILVNGVRGFVNINDVKLIPKQLIQERSYYLVENNLLHHYIYNGEAYEGPYVVGEAPEFLNEGEKAYSMDGFSFNNDIAYSYFTYLSLRTNTNYSAAELDSFLNSELEPDSPLIGFGHVFKKAEEEFNVNALFLMSLAIHESEWGTSNIATMNFNLFGNNAIDSDPVNSATQYDSFEDSVMSVAADLSNRFMTHGDHTTGYYHGAFLGSKGAGINVMYASDPYWGQKVAGRMFTIDKYLGEKDIHQYNLAIVDSHTTFLRVRLDPGYRNQALEERYEEIYQYPINGISMVIMDEVKVDGETWYKIISDNQDYEFGYVHSDYVRMLETY
ncbi:glucosaminidase domain-containing protein [Chengkuizengella axinellae]|uniref:S-layer homology domain-containing protein n=1 Tax=Chengkuizengella axinellae TaxID=3064388 RepID=A0ABT9J5Z6_9BACL|nr:glucosaminidase domain-containing protein [Chengkuizengella sp. 2205SS18-9]MDP5277041.1 S-layer homology domain-containing protein [Chengkuizengella sp. 2205SS18-9]